LFIRPVKPPPKSMNALFEGAIIARNGRNGYRGMPWRK
jgi:hypothetical protein